VAIDSLWKLCALLFADGATLSVATTPLLLLASQRFTPWHVAIAGGAASAAGSVLQLMAMRWMLAHRRPWMNRFLPARATMDATLKKYPSASFLAIAIARATPLPDTPIKIVAAVLRYPLALYGAAVLLGSLPYYFALALLGRAVRFPLWIIAVLAGVFALGVLVDALRRGRAHEAA
jgi:uncharacterized membrane protein YdjX (TVP38/TMEM64 family)